MSDYSDLEPRPRRLVEKLEELGGHAGNKTLRDQLDWKEKTYWNAREKAIAAGYVEIGRGKGGSISLIIEEPASDDQIQKESETYEPICKQIKESWVHEQLLPDDKFLVKITAFSGRRVTGGLWSRPDISALIVRKLEFIPSKFIDIITFEVKLDSQVSVQSVYEAVSHLTAATMSYVIFTTNREEFDAAQEAPRVMSVCRDHGIGLILAEKLNDRDTWETILDPVRRNTDPSRLNFFITTQFDETEQAEIKSWIT